MIGAIESFLSQAGPWSLIVVFVAIVLESSAGLGLIFPGETLALIAGAMAADSFYSAWTAFAVVALAAMTGDLTGFTIGHTKGQAVLARWAFARRQYEAHRERLEYYFEHFGGATVFVARFVAVGRAFVPFAAGLSGMRIRKFAPIAILGGLVWAAVVVGLGYALGSNWRIVEKWLKSLGAGIVVVAVLTALMAGLWRAVSRRQTQIVAAWNRHLTGRYGFDLTPFVEFVRSRLSPTGYLGLHLTVGLLAVTGLTWMFGGIVDVISEQGPLGGLDRTVALFVAALRTHRLDAAVGVIAMLANPIWLAFVVGVGALSYARRREASLSIAALLFLATAYALAYGLQAMFAKHAARQSELVLVNGFAGFPSAALTASTAGYGMLCYLLAAETQSWRLQTLSVAGALYIIALIGLAGIYSGLALSAIIGGFALGGCWLAICVTGSRTYSRLRAAGSNVV
ncbi:VTT domain-containing protein [Candidatus Binatus sp.]|uniref:VTT domain-containing protein n=1 Tax=Candidatus Binatus sp. TaxID=2811406 RepID=UPI003C767A61